MRLKDLAIMNQYTLPETTAGDYAFHYIDIGSVDGDGKVALGEPILFDSAPSRARRIVKRNDVLISTVRTYLKAIAPVDFDATDVVASTGFAVCTPTNETHPSYLAYAVRSDGVINEICKESSGISYPAINSTKLSAVEIPYCAAKAQRRIVAYLDKQTAAIDSRVAVLEQKLAAYKRLKASVINRAVTRGLDPKAKLKDSGVDWIGLVPEGWAVKRVKDLVKCLDGHRVPVDSALREEGIYPYWGAGSIQGYVKDYLFDEEIVLLGEDGAPFFDKARPVSFLVKEKVWVNNHIHVLRALRIESRFLVYCLNMVDYTNFVTGAIIQKLTQEKMNRIQIPFPPLAEQRAIADYLDAECAKIDKMAELVTREIELYRKLKRSLINEVVTGKLNVA